MLENANPNLASRPLPNTVTELTDFVEGYLDEGLSPLEIKLLISAAAVMTGRYVTYGNNEAGDWFIGLEPPTPDSDLMFYVS